MFAPAATVPKFSQAQAVPLLGDSVQLSACVSARAPAAAHSAAARRSAPRRRRLPAMLPHLQLSTLAGMKQGCRHLARHLLWPHAKYSKAALCRAAHNPAV